MDKKGRLSRRPTPYPRRIIAISVTSATTTATVITTISSSSSGMSVNTINLDGPSTSASSSTNTSSPITVTSGATTTPFVTAYGLQPPSITRRMMLTSDFILLIRRIIHTEMDRYGCHYWPFSVIAVGTPMAPDVYEIRAPHPFCWNPTGRNSDFHSIDRQLVYNSLRMIAVRFGFGLVWFAH